MVFSCSGDGVGEDPGNEVKAVSSEWRKIKYPTKERREMHFLVRVQFLSIFLTRHLKRHLKVLPLALAGK